MTYSAQSPVRRIGGRLALDFANTANWSVDGDVAQEKMRTLRDAAVWAGAAGLPDAPLPGSVGELHALRRGVRDLLTGAAPFDLARWIAPAAALRSSETLAAARQQPLTLLIAASALSILSDDRELSRVKSCPGESCGWLFIDESKNARRKWCAMDLCGNRAKASRHYRRLKASRDLTG